MASHSNFAREYTKMNTRVFNFGGLQVQLHLHPQFGFVTTTQEFSAIVGVNKSTVTRLMVKHKLLDQKLAEQDESFNRENLINANLHRSNKANNVTKVLLTTKGMIFLTMLLRTERAVAFRQEVLETIEGVEMRGHDSFASIMKEVSDLRDQVTTVIKQNEKLLAIVFEQKERIEHLETKLGYREKSDKLKRSAAGKILAAGKYDKKAELH
jgi:hypothetical protein